MGFLRLAICISGVYATFLLWAIAQERLSKPFPSTHPHASPTSAGDKFPSSVFLNFAQALASCLSATTYLAVQGVRDRSLGRRGLSGVLGLGDVFGKSPAVGPKGARGDGAGGKHAGSNGFKNGLNGVNGEHVANGAEERKGTASTVTTAKGPAPASLPALLLQVSLFHTIAGPIGFLALRHISYPTMVLGKSCKLIPVLLLNVILYRRRFSSHKYIVVALVTVGISMFMLFGKSGKKGGSGSDSLYGLSLLMINLLIDGLTNSTQDQIFSTYKSFTGQQMMFIMSLSTLIIQLPPLLIPLPSHPLALLQYLPELLSASASPPSPPIDISPPALLQSLHFLVSHPTALAPLLAYALLGGLGQLFIFETIQHFGSLTLVMVTVTRKLFTMLLSVIVFNHSLTAGQWAGVAVVFSGIGVEAGMKRRDMARKARRDKT